MEDKDALCREDLLRMQKSASITSQAGRTTMRHECLYLWIVGIQVASLFKQRTFALEGKLLGCFCEVHLPLFSLRPVTRVALSNAAVRFEIYWRFISGSCPIRSNQGRSGQIVQHMQIAQSRINTGDFASR